MSVCQIRGDNVVSTCAELFWVCLLCFCLLEIYAIIPHLPTYTVYLINQNILKFWPRRNSGKFKSSDVVLYNL